MKEKTFHALENDVLKHLQSYDVHDSQKHLLNRAVSELDRADITTMTALCELCNYAPESFKGVRNIGAKTVALLQEVCTAYKKAQKSMMEI